MAWSALLGAAMTAVNPADDAILADLDEVVSAEPRPATYQSPLMARMSGQRLTVEMLAEEIPKIRAGEAAAETLASKTRSVVKRREAQRAAREGQLAKERLFAAALPLIRTIALREYRRRQQWSSTVPLDDLMQEAIVGFFKGINGYKVEAVRKSATNYIGQWILVEMRRAAESMDHDLQVGHDAGERFRRVRALRSRLINDLEREPTDEEISAASRNPAYVTRPGMVGKAPAEGDKPALGKGLTVAQIAEERSVRDRVGRAARFASMDSGDDSAPRLNGTIDADRIVDAAGAPLTELSDPALLTDEETSDDVIASLVGRVIARMRLPEQQSEIIARRYGLAPFLEESSAREIARVMGIHRERVSRVLSAFADEMTRRGGVFHHVVSAIPEEDLADLGLGWVTTTLGQWQVQYEKTLVVPSVLTEPISLNQPDLAKATSSTTRSSGVLAWYRCDYHDRVFSALYASRSAVPKEWKCPDCQQMSPLIKTDAGSAG
jgi:RNA polymerase sigma factor (sigma-70 family)